MALDLTSATFAAGQLYVALSRCVGLEGLYLTMPVTRKHIIVEPKVTAFMLKRETTLVEGKEDPQRVEVAMPRSPEVPLGRSEQFAARDEPQHHLVHQETIPPAKKRGRPRTGRTKENVTLSLNTSVIEFLTSRSNQSETVNTLVLRSEEYQHWVQAHADTPHFN